MPQTTKLAKASLRHIASRGFDVEVGKASGSVTVTARERATGETHGVTMTKSALYLATCELAEMVGVELEDS